MGDAPWVIALVCTGAAMTPCAPGHTVPLPPQRLTWPQGRRELTRSPWLGQPAMGTGTSSRGKWPWLQGA